MPEIFLALGSNLGDRGKNLEKAVTELRVFVEVNQISPIYESEPKYVTDQPWFLNMVVAGNTALSASDLLAHLKELEVLIGRPPSERYGPRKIDLDIIFYGDNLIALPDLTIPHPSLEERMFVLRPLADIAPAKLHPASGMTVRELLGDLQGEEEFKCLAFVC